MCTGVANTLLAEHLDAMIVDEPHAARALSIHGLVHDCTGLCQHFEECNILESEVYRRLKAMLKLGADVNAALPSRMDPTERTPLHCARSAAVVVLLQDHDANVHSKCRNTDETPLHAIVSSTAISEGQKAEVCRVLLDSFAEHQSNLNSSLKSPLDVASDLGLIQLVRLFVRRPAVLIKSCNLICF